MKKYDYLHIDGINEAVIYLYIAMKRFGFFIIALLIISGCQSQKAIKEEARKIVRKEFNIVKQDVLKNFRKPMKDILYSKPHIIDYLNFAIWNNKEIDAEIARLLKVYKNMKSVYYEDPDFGITLAPIYGIFRGGAPLLREFMLSQKFPTAGKLAFEREIIYFQVKAQYYQVLAVVLDIQKEIAINLLLWEKLKKIINLKRNKLLILQKMKKYLTDSISFHRQEGHFKDIININLNITAIRKEIESLQSSIRNIKSNLGRLLYVKKYSKLRLPDLKILHTLAKENVIRDLSKNPELLKYRETIRKSTVEIDRTTRDFISDITLTLGFTLKSMDPVGNLMGKKGLLSSLMLNLPIYKKKLQSRVESSIFEQYIARFEFSNRERDFLLDFFNNNIEFYLNKSLLHILTKEIKEVNILKGYIEKLIALGESNLVNNLEIESILLDYREPMIEYTYGKIVANLKNRFLVGKFISGEGK